MYFSQNKIRIHASEHSNPMHGLESPEDATSFPEPPIYSKKINDGATKPSGVQFRDGTHGISKTDPASMANEQAAYEIGRRLNLPVPQTVRRQFPDPKTKVPITHTIQKRVGGRVLGDVNTSNQILDIENHPDWSKMAIGDWLMGNPDRHDNNMMWEKNKKHPAGRLHMIDNGEAFNYHHHLMPAQVVNGNISLDSQGLNAANLTNNFINGHENQIPQDFRDAIINANPEEHAALLNKIFGHSSFNGAPEHVRNRYGYDTSQYYGNMQPNDIKEYIINSYIARLNTLKNHFKDPNIQTLGHLYSKIFH